MLKLTLPTLLRRGPVRARLAPAKRPTHRAAIYSLALVLVLVVLTACTAASAQAPVSTLPTPVPPASLATVPPAKPPHSEASAVAGPRVDIENFNFVPATLTVPAGSTVTWVNHDDAPHTVTASNRGFSSPNLDTDGQFSFQFPTPGTYTYFCAIHPFMTASITVQ